MGGRPGAGRPDAGRTRSHGRDAEPPGRGGGQVVAVPAVDHDDEVAPPPEPAEPCLCGTGVQPAGHDPAAAAVVALEGDPHPAGGHRVEGPPGPHPHPGGHGRGPPGDERRQAGAHLRHGESLWSGGAPGVRRRVPGAEGRRHAVGTHSRGGQEQSRGAVRPTTAAGESVEREGDVAVGDARRGRDRGSGGDVAPVGRGGSVEHEGGRRGDRSGPADRRVRAGGTGHRAGRCEHHGQDEGRRAACDGDHGSAIRASRCGRGCVRPPARRSPRCPS